ncbi:MAG: serine/threonine protein kinase, partial [Desulfovibrionales bacterium]|nr:serine/threonine protein kinase [Desulfovibrionales bacterium]
MKKIGKFTICGMLGRGGMGKVLKVKFPVTDKVAALKILTPTPLLDRIIGRKRLEKIFTQEAVSLARIRHPHVMDILDFDIHQGNPYYLMEFYANTLGDLIGETHGTTPTRP